MSRTAIIITSYNRPKLVRDAILSVAEQTDHDWHCFVMDDGSTEKTRRALVDAIFESGREEQFEFVFQPHISIEERKQTLRYCRLINIALTEIVSLGLAKYACALPDDDYFYPESVGARADFLDAHPEAHVCYGRLRAVPSSGSWDWAAPPKPGRTYVYPFGPREPRPPQGGAADWVEDIDPETRRPVDEGLWCPYPIEFGKPYKADHSQVMWRVSCLAQCRGEWPWIEGRREYWPEHRDHNIGDAAFFENLAALPGHEFYPVDAWVVTRRYHTYSDGCVEHHPVVRE